MGYYYRYLKSPEWKATRTKILKRDRRCQGCGSRDRLEVHHLTYERLGHELPSDLVVLCSLCHKALHDLVEGRAPIASLFSEERARRNRQTNPAVAAYHQAQLDKEARRREQRRNRRAKKRRFSSETLDERKRARDLAENLGFLLPGEK